MDRIWHKSYEEGVPPTLSYPDKTLNDLLRDSARAHPRRIATNYVLKYVAKDRVAIGGQITYQKLERYKDKHEKVKLHQSQHKTAKGTSWGAVAGLVAGSIFLTPLFGATAGALAGGVAGRKVDIGLPDDFVKQVSAQLKPASSALVLVVTSVNKQVVVPQLQKHGGVVLSSTLSPESEAKLQAALDASQGASPAA